MKATSWWDWRKTWLLVSSFIGVNEVLALAESFGGVAFPAHVDRDSYSVLASLGAIPPEAGFAAAEVTRGCDLEALTRTCPELAGMKILRDSDSHYRRPWPPGGPRGSTCRRLSRRAVIQAIRVGARGIESCYRYILSINW